jgi:hypothetical protein
MRMCVVCLYACACAGVFACVCGEGWGRACVCASEILVTNLHLGVAYVCLCR